ncbi:TPA: hypothetical protein DEP90_00100 [Patescibacteria group bacterium]|nr:hypothetical protein [Patescibacteria group bacterium]
MKKVLEAIKEVPREEFVPNDLKEYAYINKPLGIGYKQTISQPYIVALMCELLQLKDTDTVLVKYTNLSTLKYGSTDNFDYRVFGKVSSFGLGYGNITFTTEK